MAALIIKPLDGSIFQFLNYSFQSSDIAKLTLIIGLAKMLDARQTRRKPFAPILMWCGLICGLITLSDWSSGVMLFIVSLVLLYIG